MQPKTGFAPAPASAPAAGQFTSPNGWLSKFSKNAAPVLQPPKPAQPGLLQSLFGGASKPKEPPKPPENPFTPGSILKTFFGKPGSDDKTEAAKAADQQALNTAQEYLQTANDQAQQAEDAASRAGYGNSNSRSSAAEEAQNHANAARAAADTATNAAAGHSEGANDYASQARNAADRAQAAAGRARYNASTSQ